MLDASKQFTSLDEGHFLTDREREVIRLVACGMSSRLIGEFLGISNKTVDNHRTNIMNKLHIHTTAELVRYAIKVGLG